MAEILIQDGNCISLGSIDSEEDVKPRNGSININPPPSDDRCDCCGRDVNDLKPFDETEDFFLDDCDDALLVKILRPFGLRDEQAERIYEEYFNDDQTESQRERAKQLMALNYGEKEAKSIIFAVQAAGQIGPSWECCDCIGLTDEEYFEVRRRRMKARMPDVSQSSPA